MKLRLPLFLLGCVLSLPLTMTASADVIGGGVFYDVGKFSFSDDPNAGRPAGSTLDTDRLYCWAAAASNTIQYWQDHYYGKRNKNLNPDVPNGIAQSDVYGDPTGTTYINVYQEALKLGNMNAGGEPAAFYNWWVNGGTVDDVLQNKQAYYSDLFKDSSPVRSIQGDQYQGTGPSLAAFTDFIVKSFETPGQAVSLTITGTAYHAISCWGYDLDPDTKMVSSLLLSCSDDKRFAIFRVDVEEKDCYIDYDVWLDGYENQVSLVTDEMAGYYGHDWTWILGASALQTPEGTELDATAPKLNTQLEAAQKVIDSNTSLSDNTKIEGRGIVVGNLDEQGNAKNAVVLTSTASLTDDVRVNLALDGTNSAEKETGLEIGEGGTVSLKGLSVKNYSDGGVDATGRLYLHDGDVTVSNNKKTGDGCGIANASYVEINNGGTIVFENNEASGKGGAISNVNSQPVPANIDRLHDWVNGRPYVQHEYYADEPNYTTVSIRGNKEVVFRGNSAGEGGNDIYNSEGGVVNIADNDAVRFEGTDNSDAVLNEGYLFLTAEKGKSIDFVDSTLRSVGATAIGMDVSGRTTDASGSVNFYDANENKKLSLSSRHELGGIKKQYDEESGMEILTHEYTIPALLQNVSVNVDEIAGLGTQASDSHVTETLIQTNNPLKISMLTMNTTDSIVSTSMGDVTMDTVVLDLSMAETTASGAVDLTKMLTGNYTFSDVVFIVDGLTETDLNSMTFDISSAYNDAAQELGIVLRSSQDPQVSMALSRNNVTFAFERLPEPSTGTLSLLALAGLASRRRRK